MISIIVPTYNELQRITKGLEFLLEEIKPCDELIIVDAAKSTDELKDFVCPPQLRIVKSKATSRAIQLNEGAALAQKEIIFFLHADVIPPKGFRQLIIETLSTGSELGSFSYRFNSSSLLLKLNASFTTREGLFAGGGDQDLFLRKDLFLKLGSYDESLLIMEDFDFYDRFTNAGHKYKIVIKDATVSARKYRKNSWLRVNLIQGLVFLKYKLGHSQRSILHLYQNWIR